MKKLALILGAVGAMALPGCRPDPGLVRNAAGQFTGAALEGYLNPKQTNVEVNVGGGGRGGDENNSSQTPNPYSQGYLDLMNLDTGMIEGTFMVNPHERARVNNYIISRSCTENYPQKGYLLKRFNSGGKVIKVFKFIKENGVLVVKR